MPGFLYHVGATAICPHGGQVLPIPSAPRVLVSGQPAVTAMDAHVVAGCPWAPGGAPQPCVSVRWVAPAVRVFVNRQPAVVQGSAGMSVGPAPGPVSIVATQPRARGT